jgi:hypothetical protein
LSQTIATAAALSFHDVVMSDAHSYVKSVFIMHVGGPRCVTSSTGKNMNIHVRIMLTVEFIHVFVYFYWLCKYKDEEDLTLLFD